MKKRFICLILLLCMLVLVSCNKTHTHEWSDWKIIVAADCENAGARERSCSCGEIELESIAALGHSRNDGERFEPTAARHGYTLYTCTVCSTEEKTDLASPLGSQGLTYEVNDDGKTCTVTGMGSCTDSELGIPDSIDGYEVTAIADYAFDGPNLLTYVWLGNNVKTVGFGAFRMNLGLQEVVCGDRLETIGASAFITCTRLKRVAFSDSITKIKNDAFAHCSQLELLDFGEGLKTIEYGAFTSCQSVVRVTLPQNLTEIGDSAFEFCYKLVEVINHSSLTLNKGSTSNGMVALYALTTHNEESKLIAEGDYLFIECGSVNYLIAYTGSDTELVLPQNFKGKHYQVYNFAFSKEIDMTSITIPPAAVAFGLEVFQACKKLERVEISDLKAWCQTSFTSENSNPLYHAKKLYLNGELLVNAAIPEDTLFIQPYAFINCESIQNIVIPKSVVGIGQSAFDGCSFLNAVYYAGVLENWNRIDIEDKNHSLPKQIYYYSETQPTSLASRYWRYVNGVPTRWE